MPARSLCAQRNDLASATFDDFQKLIGPQRQRRALLVLVARPIIDAGYTVFVSGNMIEHRLDDVRRHARLRHHRRHGAAQVVVGPRRDLGTRGLDARIDQHLGRRPAGEAAQSAPTENEFAAHPRPPREDRLRRFGQRHDVVATILGAHARQHDFVTENFGQQRKMVDPAQTPQV